MTPPSSTTLNVSFGATLTAWLPMIDTDLRILASLVAIISGVLYCVLAVRKFRK